MSVHLVGGGPLGATDVVPALLAEAARRGSAVGRTTPRIALLSAGEVHDVSGIVAELEHDGVGLIVQHAGSASDVFDTTVLSDVDALVVTGTDAVETLAAIAPLTDQLRLLVSDGLPYLGHDAGAAIAADRALVGGWRIGGVEVCASDSSSGLDEVTVSEGLGLVDLTIDTGAVQRGTLSRLIAATEAGLVAAALGIDDETALIVGEGPLTVSGTGSVWRVVGLPDESGVSVATMGA